ncbi:hypothetical protein C8R43DRAFT_37783 [Mycena crocata]|nr:hypothetical protein C8R43DRAFT_37783 [Mycena crocata]
MKSLQSLAFSSMFTALFAVHSAAAAFSCSMKVDVNSRACANLSCAITGQYLAGQIVAFDCVNASPGPVVAGSAWWARDPLKHFVPVGDMIGVDGFPCDTHLGLCASLPPA